MSKLCLPPVVLHGENDSVASTRRFVNIASSKQSVVVTISIVKPTII